MELSQELLSQFAKQVVKDDSPGSETTVYGTIVVSGENKYVRLDGSDQLTSLSNDNNPSVDSTLANADDGERVAVLIKNHTATIVGNLSSPAAGTGYVDNKIAEYDVLMAKQIEGIEGRFGTLEADVITTGELDAAKAEITELVNKRATIEQLEAEEARVDDLLAKKIDADIVNAEFAEIKRLKADQADIDELDARIANIDNLKADKAVVEELQAKDAEIENLVAEKVSTEQLKAVNGEIDKLKSEDATIKNLVAQKASIEDLKAVNGEITKLKAKDADIEAAVVKKATIDSLNAEKARIDSLTAEVAKIDNLKADDAEIKDLLTEKANVKDLNANYANIDFANIGEAALTALFTKAGIIENLVVGDTTVTGEWVGVTIKGDLIETGTLKADRLVVKGSDGNYYALNTDFAAIPGVTPVEEDVIHGSILVKQSITAEKISVKDLVAFDATIGGFKIGDKSIYSGVKESVDNTTAGVYLDSDGQIAFGDGTSYVKFYEDSSGNRKLVIAADEITFGSSKKSVEDAISEIQVGGRNLLFNSSFRENKDEWNSSAAVKITTLDDGVSCAHVSGILDGTMQTYQDVTNAIKDDPVDQPYVISADINLQNYIAGTTKPAMYFYTGSNTTNTLGGSSDLTQYNNQGWVRAYWCISFATKPSTARVSILARDFEGDLYFKNLKFERGTKPSDWTPAPEDYYTKTETEAKIEVASNSITSTVRTEYTEAIENIQVGGRNIFLNSSFNKDLDDWSKSTATMTELDGVPCGHVEGALGSMRSVYQNIYDRIKDDPAKQHYVISADINLKNYVAGTTNPMMQFYFNAYYDKDGERTWNTTRSASGSRDFAQYNNQGWVRVYWEVYFDYKPIELIAYLYFRDFTGDIYFKNVKFERGSKLTDWSPAPEDLGTTKDVENAQNSANNAADRLDSAESMIKQLSDTINQIVVRNDGGYSLQSQTADGTIFTTGDLQTIADKLGTDIETLLAKYGDEGSTTAIINKLNEQLTALTGYVAVGGTFEDEPSIELVGGGNKSGFKVIITNTRILFYDGSTVAAYVTNQTLNINKALIEEELVVTSHQPEDHGEFVWKIRPNGNIGLSWREVVTNARTYRR